MQMIKITINSGKAANPKKKRCSHLSYSSCPLTCTSQKTVFPFGEGTPVALDPQLSIQGLWVFFVPLECDEYPDRRDSVSSSWPFLLSVRRRGSSKWETSSLFWGTRQRSSLLHFLWMMVMIQTPPKKSTWLIITWSPIDSPSHVS